MSRVFVGGVGCVKGGRLDRSRESDLFDEGRRAKIGREGDPGDEIGEVVPDMAAVM